MLKCISLPEGPGGINTYDDYSSQYGFSTGNRSYILSGSHPTDVVGLWVSWAAIQQGSPPPTSLWDSFNQLNSWPGWAGLDAQIHTANADGRQVMLTIGHYFPDFSNGNRWAEYIAPGSKEHQSGPQNRNYVYPDALDANSPWAWFIWYLLSRYLRGAPINAVGPHQPGSGEPSSVQYGNTTQAYVDYIQPMNEPNLLWRPQVNTDGVSRSVLYCNIASAMQTAVSVSAFFVNRSGFPYYGAKMLVPGVADVRNNGNGTSATEWGTFTQNILQNLSNWTPPAYAGWAMHNYQDIKLNNTQAADGTRYLLQLYSFSDRTVWLTEGGREFDVTHNGAFGTYTVNGGQGGLQAIAQDNDLRDNYAAMKAAGYAQMYTQYLIHDNPTAIFESSLRGQTTLDGNGHPNGVAPTPNAAYLRWPGLG